MLLRNGRALKPYQNGNWYMQTHVFSGIIILEGIMSAKMSGMDVDLELALCYRQSFWIMSWAMTWKFQIRAFDRDHSGWLRMRVNRLKLALFKCDRGSASTKCNWRERFVGKMCCTDFLVPLKPTTIALFAEKNIGCPAMLNCIWCARSLCWTWRTASSPSALFWPWPPPLCTSTRLNLVSSICKLFINVQSIVVDSR